MPLIRTLRSALLACMCCAASGCISLAVDATVAAVKLPVKVGAAVVSTGVIVGKTVVKTGAAAVDVVTGGGD